MAYQNKVKSSPSVIVKQAIGIKDVNIGVNTNRTYGGSPYTGWYNTFDVLTTEPEGIVMYKANTPAEGTIYPDGAWETNPNAGNISFDLGSSWTIECWVLFPNTNFTCSIVNFLANSVGVNGVFDFGFDVMGRPKFDFNGVNVVTGPTPITLNSWTHVAITRDDTGTVNLYVQGNNVDSDILSFPYFGVIGMVEFFGGTQVGTFYFTNLRVVTQTAIYPTESLVTPYPLYPLNRSYDDTALLILGKKASNFAKDYSLNDATFAFRGSPYLDPTIATPLLKIIDATKVSISPWNIPNISNGLLELINGHPSRFGQPYFTTVADAVDWAFNISTDPFMFSNISYEETDGGTPYFNDCAMFLDSGNISSFPIVGINHFNLKQYNAFGQIDARAVGYQETYGGRLFLAKPVPLLTPLFYSVGSLDVSSFIYYGVLGFANTFNNAHDIVGFYGGDHNWRVERISSNDARLIITNGAGDEINLGGFNITDTEYPSPYFGLLVSYDNISGNYYVYVNGVNELTGNATLSRPTATGGSTFIWGRETFPTGMYHYTSAVWPTEEANVPFALSMGDALSVRYPGIV